MTIDSGAPLFGYGTQVTVISDILAIANTSFNAGTVTQFTPTDVTPLADAVLDIALAVAPAAGKAVHLYRRDMNIDGVNHAPVPDANFKSIYLGSFPLDLVTTRQFISLTDIPLTKDQEFYIENDSGQSTSGTTVLKVTPKSYNAKA